MISVKFGANNVPIEFIHFPGVWTATRKSSAT